MREYQDAERSVQSRVDLIERLKASGTCGDRALDAIRQQPSIELRLVTLKRTLEIRARARSATDAVDFALNLNYAPVALNRFSYDDAEGLQVVATPRCPQPETPR